MSYVEKLIEARRLEHAKRLQNAINDAENMGMHDIAELFRLGGEELIDDLHENNYALLPYFDNGSSADAEEYYSSDEACDYLHDSALFRLQSLMRKLTNRNSAIVEKFLISIGEMRSNKSDG